VTNLASPPKVKSATLELHRGEIFGIGGLVGSGRTELVRALFGLALSTGDIELHGKMVSRPVAADQIRNGVGYLSEDRKHEGLYLQLSIAENLTATAAIARNGWIAEQEENKVSEQIIAALRIRSATPRSAVVRLSGGNQQKIAFGRLLHQDPDILLLDEPTRGIDIRSKTDIYREIRRLADSGKGILLVSSYLPELLGICDRVAVMNRGVLSPARATSAWTPHSIMDAAISVSPGLAETR
jgi:ribose transport system ATP-binding protein